MGTTLAVSFPLGRYHATSWGGGANTSDPEWPPSPWRIHRALVATWYTRWPDLPAAELDRLLANLGNPDAYRTPPVRAGSTRHYLPDSGHTSAETGGTDLVIDGFLAVPPDERVLIHWHTALEPDDRAVLGKLAELMPYLGRSESICAAELLDGDIAPDESWWRLGEAGDDVRSVTVLAPDEPVQRAVLEVSTTQVRKARKLDPPGTRWVSYGWHGPGPVTEARRRKRSMRPPATWVRFDLSSTVPVQAGSGILVADALHARVATVLDGVEGGDAVLGVDDGGRPVSGPHQHLHVLWWPHEVGAQTTATAALATALAWVPDGLTDAQVAALQTITTIWTRPHLAGEMGMQHLFAAGFGDASELSDEVAGPARRWVSATPYFPVRHVRRRETEAEYLTTDVVRECGYRGLPMPERVLGSDQSRHRRNLVRFRSRRPSERREDRQRDLSRQAAPAARRQAPRTGRYLAIEFGEDVTGPIALGQLSHFGFGLFVPER